MKLSISNIGWEEKNDEKVYELLKKYGFLGVEIAPTRWIMEQPYEHRKEAVAIAKKLKETYGFVIPSMQSIWFGKQEHMFLSKVEREELLSYTQKAIDYASAIECKNLVFGCPRNRNVEEEWKLSKQQVQEIAVDFFGTLGEYAKKQGVVLAMEANPPIYHTNYINTTKEALDLIKETASKGFLLNLDVGTMIANEEAVERLASEVALIHHVHISEPELKPVKKRKLHEELAELLRKNQYQGFVSIEVGKQEQIDRLEEMIAYVAEVFHDEV